MCDIMPKVGNRGAFFLATALKGNFGRISRQFQCSVCLKHIVNISKAFRKESLLAKVHLENVLATGQKSDPFENDCCRSRATQSDRSDA